MRAKPSIFFLWIVITTLYFFAAKLGLSLAFEQANTSPVWPPTGIAIAAIFHFGLRVSPAVFAGAFLANLLTETPLLVALCIATGNSLEAIVASIFLHRYLNKASLFDSIDHIVSFVAIVSIATMISATIGVLSLYLGGVIPKQIFTLLWSTWWLGDLVGGLVVAPFILVCLKSKPSQWRKLVSVSTFLIGFCTAAACIAIFGDDSPIAEENYPLAFIFLPLAIWVAYRTQELGSAIFIFLVSALAIYGTLLGNGPFVRASENESLLLLQAFMGVMMFTTLALSASLAENKKARRVLALNQEVLEGIVDQQRGDLYSASKQIKIAESVFKNSVDAIMVTDENANILRVNPSFTRLTGFSEEEARGKNPRIMKSGRHDSNFYQRFWDALETEHCWQGEISNRRKDGIIYPTWQTATAVVDKKGRIQQYIGIFSDISDKKLSEDRIHHLAHYDNLTDLYNRGAFYEQLQKAISVANRQSQSIALLYIDLDNFKLINDASGHPVGDRLLKHVAERIKHTVREEDSIARLGGDEFVILLVDIKHPEDAARVAQKVLTEITQPVNLDHNEIVATGSIGISSFPSDSTDADSLLKNADIAMYKAKEKGRNTFQFFTSEMNKQAQERLLLESDMRKGILNEEFILHYQAQSNISSQQISGCEALVRWQHPTRGLIPPNVFIPVAEESGLIKDLGKWIMREACRQQVEWKKNHGIDLTIAVNVSARQFISRKLITEVSAIIEETGVEPSGLELELTESIIMENVEETISVLQTLQSMGVKLAVDDFGTGYSSMAYLKRFPIDKLKIDQSFVRDIADDPNDAAIVKATVLMAHGLKIDVIAEGVETQEQLNFLKEVGCNEMQGYYLSKPLEPNSFVSWMNR